MTITRRIALAALLLGAAHGIEAQEGRSFNPIARPSAAATVPSGAVRISPPAGITREKVERAVGAVAAAWNERRIREVLAPGFPRRDELEVALQTRVPRAAVLRIMAIQGWQVLEQYRMDGQRISKISVTVRTQVEFNDATAGHQVRDGINEYVVTLTEAGMS